jgi:isochorismate pyruvate lyase
MTTSEAKACETLAEVRRGIDALDAALLDLIARRVAYIERAAEIKPAIGAPAAIPERVEEVLRNVSEGARARGVPGDLAERLWRLMIGWSIDRETQLMSAADAKRPG